MPTTIVNKKFGHVCAFCKYWHDPANQHIRPIKPNVDMWEYDKQAECMCLKTGMKKPGFSSCREFILKF